MADKQITHDRISSDEPAWEFTRRDFFKYLAASSAVSLAVLNRATAAVYQSISSLNQKYIKDESPDGVYWEGIKKQFLFEDELIMMNNGTVGPVPKPVFNTLMKSVYISGLISPIKELSQLAHEKGILIQADSAHGIGMLDLNMKDLGVDFFSSSPYKWLGAPTGVGLLYVRKEAQDTLWPTIVTGGWDTFQDARKYETHGQDADALIFALGEALDFQNAIGRKRIERRIKALAGYLKQELRKIPGVKIHTPDDPYLSGGLTAFSMDGVDPVRLVDYVREKYNLVVRRVGSKEAGTYAVRVSTPIYVSFKDTDLLLEGVRELLRHQA